MFEDFSLPEHMRLFELADGTRIFPVIDHGERTTGKVISYLIAERNGEHHRFGFDPSKECSVAIAVAEFERYLQNCA